jgi:DnaJ-class molecular chaperone
VASDSGDTQDLIEGTHEPRECMACRGTGRVISNLGGTPSTVECPWCSGSGLRPAEVDAQAHWGEAGAEGSAAGDGAPGDAETQPADGQSAEH